MRHRTAQPRGVAMLMVIVVIAMVSVMGMAMLSSASLQAQAAVNATHAASAQSLAMSGVDLASYYLLYPTKAPSLNGRGYWSGGSRIELQAGGAAGWISVSVNRVAEGVYDVTSIGNVPSLQTVVQQTARVRLAFRRNTQITQALLLGGNGTIRSNMTVNGNVQYAGTVINSADLNGYVYANGYVPMFGSSHWGTIPLTTVDPVAVPNWSSLRDYRTYTYGGVEYQAQQIPAGTLSAGTTLAPSAANPCGVFWSDGTLSVRDDVKITGCLIVRDGSLELAGRNVKITGVEGLPALVVQNSILTKNVKSMSVDGLAWVGGSIGPAASANGNKSTVKVSGALIFAGSGTVDSAFRGSVTVTYDRARASVDNLNRSSASPGVRVVHWDP